MESQFKSNPNFRNVYVKGEVSDMFISAYGHLYFNLKDKKSQVPCIVYKWFRRNLQFDIEDGMKLLVIANVVVYAPHGKYQLDVRSATEDGLGQLY
ncbi:exodeoxyribonuclease VII large subunit, partial [Methanobrevibacter sp.]